MRNFGILECPEKKYVPLSVIFLKAELNFECFFFLSHLLIIKVSDMFSYCCLIVMSVLNHNIGVYICCLL